MVQQRHFVAKCGIVSLKKRGVAINPNHRQGSLWRRSECQGQRESTKDQRISAPADSVAIFVVNINNPDRGSLALKCPIAGFWGGGSDGGLFVLRREAFCFPVRMTVDVVTWATVTGKLANPLSGTVHCCCGHRRDVMTTAQLACIFWIISGCFYLRMCLFFCADSKLTHYSPKHGDVQLLGPLGCKLTDPFVQIWGPCVDLLTGRSRRCKKGGGEGVETWTKSMRGGSWGRSTTRTSRARPAWPRWGAEKLHWSFNMYLLFLQWCDLLCSPPEPQCCLQSCQREVRGSLHPHSSWKQLEHQLPLCQREISSSHVILV